MPRLTPVDWKILIRVFETKGFKYARTRGDHLIYSKPGILRPIVIPKYRGIPEFIILNNLKTAKITRKEYLELLKKV